MRIKTLDCLTARLVVSLLTFGVARPALAADAHGHDAHAAPVVADDHKADAAVPAPASALSHAAPEGVPAAAAIQMLVDGNDRFVNAQLDRPHQDQARRCDTNANGQHPVAAVLACADSRVPVELVFDAGIGDLFVVRVAGNVADTDEVGTIEYGVEHLGINAIVVMGHTKCGAVTAVVDGAKVTPNIAKLVDNIVPAAQDARKRYPTATGPLLVAKAIEANVRRASAELMERSPLLKERVEAGTLKIVGGVYDLHTGQVRWIDATPSTVPVAPARLDVDASHDAPAAGHSGEHAEPADHDAPHSPTDAKASNAAHDEDSGDAHAIHDALTSHDETDATRHPDDAHAAAKPPIQKDNFLALGGLLVGSTAVSGSLIHFVYGRAARSA
jgi:carbonic anhydrase